MRSRRIVVIGASVAGWRTVEALRRSGSRDHITLIGAEPHLPYDRPPLSKELLLGKLGRDDVRLSAAATDAIEVDLILGTRATAVDVERRVVTLQGETSGELEYDELVIATGSRAIRPAAVPDLAGIHTLRTLDDALAIRAELESDPRVVVLGGGFIGVEVASAARALGLDVTIIDREHVLMRRALGETIGERMTEIIRADGVDLRLGLTVTGWHGTDHVEAVELSDGSLLHANLVVLGLGAVPETEWLADSGLTIEDGVVCDERLLAAPGVHAVGDVARWFHPGYQRLMRMEHWTTAGEHADAVAATLTGTPTPAAEIPLAWSDQFDQKLQIAGVVSPDDDIHFLVDEPGRFVAIAGSAGVQHAAVALNAAGALVRHRMKLAARPPWPTENI